MVLNGYTAMNSTSPGYNFSNLPLTANNTSLDEHLYVASYLHHKHRPVYEANILSLVYGTIFISGVIGNLATCIVISRNAILQTATNYYLFSLAISDLMTLVIGKFYDYIYTF